MEGLDPSYNGSGTPNPNATMLANETLLGFKVGPDVAYDEMVLEPKLAERWETSPDAKTFGVLGPGTPRRNSSCV